MERNRRENEAKIAHSQGSGTRFLVCLARPGFAKPGRVKPSLNTTEFVSSGRAMASARVVASLVFAKPGLAKKYGFALLRVSIALSSYFKLHYIVLHSFKSLHCKHRLAQKKTFFTTKRPNKKDDKKENTEGAVVLSSCFLIIYLFWNYLLINSSPAPLCTYCTLGMTAL